MKEFTIISKYDENIILIKDKDSYFIDIDINSNSEKAFSRIHIEKSQLKKVKDFLNKLEDLEYERNSFEDLQQFLKGIHSEKPSLFSFIK